MRLFNKRVSPHSLGIDVTHLIDSGKEKLTLSSVRGRGRIPLYLSLLVFDHP